MIISDTRSDDSGTAVAVVSHENSDGATTATILVLFYLKRISNNIN